VLPDHESLHTLCEDFSTFITEKIVKIRDILNQDKQTRNPSMSPITSVVGKRLESFKDVSEEKDEKLI